MLNIIEQVKNLEVIKIVGTLVVNKEAVLGLEDLLDQIPWVTKRAVIE